MTIGFERKSFEKIEYLYSYTFDEHELDLLNEYIEYVFGISGVEVFEPLTMSEVANFYDYDNRAEYDTWLELTKRLREPHEGKTSSGRTYEFSIGDIITEWVSEALWSDDNSVCLGGEVEDYVDDYNLPDRSQRVN